jgi:hypothetical protein
VGCSNVKHVGLAASCYAGFSVYSIYLALWPTSQRVSHRCGEPAGAGRSRESRLSRKGRCSKGCHGRPPTIQKRKHNV